RLDDQPRRRELGRGPRRHHRRRSHARPAPAPLRGAQPRRRLLPPTRPPRQERSTPSRRDRHPPTATVTPAQGWGLSMSITGEFRRAPSEFTFHRSHERTITMTAPHIVDPAGLLGEAL